MHGLRGTIDTMTADAQKHDYATAPHGSFELPQELLPNADLRARLSRPAVGASDDEAVALIELLPADVIRSESDDLLAARVQDYRDGGPYLPGDHAIKDVLSHVGDDPDKARDMLVLERDGKDRSTLVAKLEDIVAADQTTTPPVVATPGDADTAGDAADGPHV